MTDWAHEIIHVLHKIRLTPPPPRFSRRRPYIFNMILNFKTFLQTPELRVSCFEPVSHYGLKLSDMPKVKRQPDKIKCVSHSAIP